MSEDIDALLNELDENGVTKVDTNIVKSKEIEAELGNNLISDTEQVNAEKMLKHIDESKVKVINLELENIDYSEEFKEVMDETRRYIKDAFEIETQIKELRDDLKTLRQDAKDEGVKVTVAGKAIKELVNELKESSEDAKATEDMKKMIKNDPGLYPVVLEKAN